LVLEAKLTLLNNTPFPIENPFSRCALSQTTFRAQDSMPGSVFARAIFPANANCVESWLMESLETARKHEPCASGFDVFSLQLPPRNYRYSAAFQEILKAT